MLTILEIIVIRGEKMDDKKNILLATISDLSGNLKLLDTKVSILIAAAGVIFGALISCRGNIFKAYNYFSMIPYLKYIFLILTICYIVSIVIFISYGLSTIMPRIGKSRKNSIWFFDTDIVSEEKYKEKISNYSTQDLLECLESEVYKLNQINRNKIKRSRIAIKTFKVSCYIFMSVMIMVGIFYICV